MYCLFKNVHGVQAFQDDILIFAKTMQQHNMILDKVLSILCDYGITVSRDKCRFLTRSVDYLGHCITSDGVKPKKGLIKALGDIPSRIIRLN